MAVHVKTYSTEQRRNINVNSGLQLVIMCQYWLIGSNKHTILMQDVDIRGNRRGKEGI